MGNYRDTMQVCMNGHVVNASYNRSPEFRKNYCLQCEATTTTKCSHCGTDIPGKLHIDGVLDFISGGPVAPLICDNCGKRFPWYEQRKKASEANIAANLREAEEQKFEKRLASLKKVEVKVEGHGNVVSMGGVIDSVIANTVKLNSRGDQQVAKALEELTNAIEASSDASDAQKTVHLEQLAMLSEEALKPADKRLSRSILKPVIDAGLGSLNVVADMAQIWGTWGPVIKTFFLGVS